MWVMHIRFAILSDTHLGYKFADPELSEDSFTNLDRAIDKIIQQDVDFVLLAGDVFDKPIIPLDVGKKAIESFHRLKYSKSLHNEIQSSKELSPLQKEGLPIFAVYGNHDRRSVGKTNPVQLLESTGTLICLHNSWVKIGDVFIYGISSVPELYAKKLFHKSLGTVEKSGFSILLMHQSIDGFLPDATLTLDDLKGFDLVVNGHIHTPYTKDFGNWQFMIAGSTIATQLRREEAEKQRGIFVYDTESRTHEFIPIQTRKFIHKTLKFDNASTHEIELEIRNILSQTPTDTPKPRLKVVLKGTLSKGERVANLNLKSISDEFSNKFIVLFDKKLVPAEFSSVKQKLNDVASSWALGTQMIVDIMKEMGYDVSVSELESLSDSS